MQDLQRLEQLSSTAALGMWANDAILALDRIARGKAAGDEDFALLGEAAAALDAASHERDQPDGPMSAVSIAFVERALDVAERMNIGKGGDAARALLAELSKELRQVVETRKAEDPQKAVAFFSALSRQQLAATQSVLNSRQEASWTAGPVTLSFS
jgi:hypothetical protein